MARKKPKNPRTPMQQMLAEAERKINPPKPRGPTGPLPTFSCIACGEESKGVAAADQHVIDKRHYRYKQVFAEVPK